MVIATHLQKDKSKRRGIRNEIEDLKGVVEGKKKNWRSVVIAKGDQARGVMNRWLVLS